MEVISNLHVLESKFGGKIYKFGGKSLKWLSSAEFMEFVFSKSAEWCNVVQCSSVSFVQCDAMQCSAKQYGAVH